MAKTLMTHIKSPLGHRVHQEKSIWVHISFEFQIWPYKGKAGYMTPTATATLIRTWTIYISYIIYIISYLICPYLQRYGGVHDTYSYGHIDPYLNAKHGYGFSNGYGYNQVDIDKGVHQICFVYQTQTYITCQKFTISTKPHNFNHSSRCQSKFRISTKFQKCDYIFQLFLTVHIP